MSQSSSNANSTNQNTPSTPQSQQIPISGFANFANQINPVLSNQIPQFSQQQQQQILNHFYFTQQQQHQQQQQPGPVPFPNPFSPNFQQQYYLQQQQIFQQSQTQPQPQPQPQSEIEIFPETQEIVEETEQPESSKPRKKKICKKIQWSADEEELLAKMWIHVSEDSDIGINQPGPVFWRRIVDEYNSQAALLGFSERNKDQLNSKFTAMSTQVKSFIGHYAEAERLRGSGEDDSKVKEAAHRMFKNAEVTAFRYEKAWLVWKDKSKYRTFAKIETPVATINLDDVEIPDDIFADDPPARPRGKSRGSKRKESSSASEHAQSSSSAFCGSILEQFKKLTKSKKSVDKSKKEVLKVQQEAAFAKLRREDIAFLQTNTVGMDENEAQWVENEKNRIREKYGIV